MDGIWLEAPDPYGPIVYAFFSTEIRPTSGWFHYMVVYLLQDDYIVEHNFTYDLQKDILVHPKSRMSWLEQKFLLDLRLPQASVDEKLEPTFLANLSDFSG